MNQTPILKAKTLTRTYRDPIHKEIHLDSEDPVEGLVIQLIDCREMQRLRWIRQLGTSWFTFHGAEGSRFQHSIGTMHIARSMLDKVCRELNIDFSVYQEYKVLVLCAALLHDIGHGPFSHSCEKITNIKHEQWTQKLILNSDTEINQVMRVFDSELPGKVANVLNKSYPVKFLCNIVNSQLDCDRFDYLMRDSYYTGTAYGNFDLDRVISSISCNIAHDCLVVSGQKGMLAVEDYLYARYSMYLQVYQHKKCLATESLLQKLFKRAKLLANSKRISYLEDPLQHWITPGDKFSTEDFLAVDDINVLHHIKHWCEEKDVVLKDLAQRFIHRKLFRASKIERDQNAEVIYQDKAEELRKSGYDPEYYLDLVTIASNPYSFYNPDKSNYFKAIFVEEIPGSNNLKEISELSHVVASLVKNDFAHRWLIST
jgi:HD superfamily phosphohydrolase